MKVQSTSQQKVYIDHNMNKNNNDGPLGKAPEINVGVSDSIIIGVSMIGFCFLAYTLYNIIVKVKSSRELDIEGEENEKSFEELLAQADVSTLTRAQRRARARHIMKQQRRAAGDEVQAVDGDGDEQQEHVEIIPHHHQNEDQHPSLRNLKSRKERQKVAKQIEVQERKLLETQRLKEQQIAQQEALQKKKEREEIQKLQQEKEKQIRMEQSTKKELIEYYKWKTFLPSPSVDDDIDDPTELTKDNNTRNSITVKAFIEMMEKRNHKSMEIEELSTQYNTSKEDIRERIQQLIDCGRLTGILTTSGSFIYLSPNDMLSLATTIKQHGNNAQDIDIQWLRTQIQKQVMVGS